MENTPTTPEEIDDLIDILEAIAGSGDVASELRDLIDRLYEDQDAMIERMKMRAERRARRAA